MGRGKKKDAPKMLSHIVLSLRTVGPSLLHRKLIIPAMDQTSGCPAKARP